MSVSTAGFAPCHSSGPVWTTWGQCILLQTKRFYVCQTSYRYRLAATFTVGKCNVHSFSTRDEAQRFIDSHRDSLRGRVVVPVTGREYDEMVGRARRATKGSR